MVSIINPYRFVKFSPLDLGAALIGWYDASDTDTITDSAGAVSQWDDKSGNLYHLTQGDGALQPTTNSRTINSLNGLDFTGDLMLNTANAASLLPINTDIYIFYVCVYDAPTEQIVIYGKDGAGLQNGPSYAGYDTSGTLHMQGGTSLGAATPQADLEDNNGTYAGADGTTTLSAATTYMQMARWDRTAANPAAECWLAGTQEGTGAGGAAAGDNAAGTFIVGAHGSANQQATRRFDGILGEVIVAHGISAAQRQDVEGFLNDKWAA